MGDDSDVIGHVTIRLAVINFLRVVYCYHASIWHSYGDMAPQSTCTHTERRTERTIF